MGTEVAVPVVDTGDGPRALPVGVDRRRTAGSTTTPPATPPAAPSSRCPAKLSDELAAECARVAVARPRGARAARPVPLRPDHRRRGHGLVPRGERRPGAHRDLHGAALGDRRRSRPRASWSPIWYEQQSNASPAADPNVRTPVRDITYPPIIVTAKVGFKALGPALPDARHRARPAHRRRAAGAQPHLLRRLHPRRLRRPRPPSGWCGSWPSGSSSTTGGPAR